MATRKKPIRPKRSVPAPSTSVPLQPNPNVLTGPQFELEIGDQPDATPAALYEARRQSLADQSKQLTEASKFAARLEAAREDYRKDVEAKFDTSALAAVRKRVAADTKKLRAAELDFDENGVYQPGKIEEANSSRGKTYERALKAKGVVPQDLKKIAAANAARVAKSLAPSFKSSPSTRMIMRNWTAEVEAPNDPDLRQILRYFTHRRIQTSDVGNRDVLQTHTVADRDRRLVGTHHIWENRDVGDFEYFGINMDCQLGHGLWLKAGESMQVIAHMRSVDNLLQIHGHDEWGWSSASLSSKNFAVLQLGAQRREHLLWVINHNITDLTKRPYLGGQRAIIVADFGPVPADGFYVLWAGTRTNMYAFQNDWSLNVLMRSFWEVQQVLIRQTPDQRR